VIQEPYTRQIVNVKELMLPTALHQYVNERTWGRLLPAERRALNYEKEVAE